MKKKKEDIINAIKDKNLYIFLIISMLFFGIFCIIQYAPDTYSVFVNGTRVTTMHFFSCGRFVTGFAFAVVKGILKLNNQSIYMLSYLFAVLCTTISLYKIYGLIKKDIKYNIICIIISTLIIINPFSLELFLYIEKGILMFSILMCVMAVEELDRFFKGNRKAFILAMLYMFIANCSYQGTVGLFVTIACIYIIKYSKNIKSFIKNNVLVGCLYGIPAVINFILVRFIFTNSRVEGEIILGESVNKIIDGILRIFKDNYGLLPKYLFSTIIACILIFIIYKAIISKKEIKEKILDILGAFYLLLGTVVVTVVPQIMQNTNSIWFVPRSSYPIAAIIGILLLYLFMKFEIKNSSKNLIVIVTILFLFTQFIYFMQYAIDGYIVNYEDKQNVNKILEEIAEYEKKTGNKVDKIAFYQDKNPNYTYYNIKSTGDINIKALYPEWSAIKIIEFYSGRSFTQVEKDEKLTNEFSLKDWNYYNKEQVICIGDTIHICNY